jgi:DNA-binding beta-propeller fold protein YncE
MQTILSKGRVYNYSHCVGNNAVSETGFHYPNGIVRGPGNVIYVLNQPDELQPVPHVSVADVGNDWHQEEWIKDFGDLGETDGNFVWPAGIARDGDGNIYVSDQWLHRISVFDKDGKFLYKFGAKGSGKGQLSGPTGLAVDSRGNVYVSEYENHRVQKFTKEGKHLMMWGGLGGEHGQFRHPWGIATDKDDNVYVADWRNDRVEKFTSDGEYLMTFGSVGSGKGQYQRPSAVAVDKDGDVYICDWWNHKVEVFDVKGGYVTTFVGDAERLSKWGEARVKSNPDAVKARLRMKTLEMEWRFNRPTAIAAGDDGRIMVVESQRMRVQIYKKEQNWTEPQFNL